MARIEVIPGSAADGLGVDLEAQTLVRPWEQAEGEEA